VKGIPSWVTYTVLRLLVFVIPLAVLLVLRIDAWIAVVAAALIGLCLSYIFLRKPRDAVATDLYAARHRDKPATTVDDDVEDAAIDSAEHSADRPAEHPVEQPKPHDTTA
jgi:hypothetical protein